MYLPPSEPSWSVLGELYKLNCCCLHKGYYVPVPEKQYVFSEVETESLNVIQMDFSLQSFKQDTK